RVIDRRRPADEVRQLVAEFLEKFRILRIVGIGLVQLGQRVRQGFGDEAAAVRAEVPDRVRQGVIRGLEQRRSLKLGRDGVFRDHGATRYRWWYRLPAPPR